MVQIAFAYSKRTKITHAFNEGNKRSEQRWLFSATEALLQADWVTAIYSLLPIWYSPEPRPTKFLGELPVDECQNVICLADGFAHIQSPDYQFKGLVINSIGEGMDPIWIAKREEQKQKYGDKFFYTFGYFWPNGLREASAYLDNIEFCPIPLIPKIESSISHFGKKTILWPRRGIFSYLERKDLYYERPFKWIANKLAANQEIEFHIISGDMNPEHTRDYLFSDPALQPLMPYQERVFLHLDLGWPEVQALYQQTKMVIGPPGPCFENTEIEAGACGIPVIQGNYAPELDWALVASWNSFEYYLALDNLYNNEQFYDKLGAQSRDFVTKHHTYQAYSDNLYRLLDKKGLLR